VIELLDSGVNVISAVNVQHLESLNDVIASTLGVTVRETLPDWIVTTADQVINLDISAEDLRDRLREGKIYAAEKIDTALRNFFTDENLTTLRELALREVASSVDRTREAIALRESGVHKQPRTVDRVLVAMSSDPPYTATLLRKASRIAGRLNSDWYCVYVQTPDERPDRIDSAVQRKLVDNIQLAQSMGAEVVKLQGTDVAEALSRFARDKGVTLLIVGQSRRLGIRRILHESVVKKLINNSQGLDVLVVSFGAARPTRRRENEDLASPLPDGAAGDHWRTRRRGAGVLGTIRARGTAAVGRCRRCCNDRIGRALVEQCAIRRSAYRAACGRWV
jgi:two-component system sensor histidine kinase KdpD